MDERVCNTSRERLHFYVTMDSFTASLYREDIGFLCKKNLNNQIQFFSGNQYLVTSKSDCLGFADLLSFDSSKKRIFTEKNFSENEKKIIDLIHLKKISTRNFISISSLVYNFSSSAYKVDQIGFTVYNSTLPIISLSKCPTTNCTSCLIDGFLHSVDLLNGNLSQVSNNGTFVQYPPVATPNLGFHRVRFNGSYPLLRYNEFCFDTIFSY